MDRTDPASEDLILSSCFLSYSAAKIASQCNYNIIVSLCSFCKWDDSFSSDLGSNGCHKCHKYMLFQIVVFSIAGNVQFGGTFLLEITIANGWTKYVTFFCNVVAIYVFT